LVSGYQVDGEVTEEMKAFVRNAALPLTAQEVVEELSMLAALTKRRNTDDADTAILIRAYAEKLSEYPADVVKYVLASTARNNVFFPAWAELYEDLEFWGRRRLRLRDAVLGAG
jgi:hypothetical protein